MDKPRCSILTVPLYLLLTWCAQAQCSDPADGPNEAPGAKIILTKFEITDTTLELGFQITNGSDHNVWICDDVAGNLGAGVHFEAYMAKDEQTLVIRRRFDVPSAYVWNEQPAARYVRLRPGEDRTESLSLALPVEP